MRHLLLLAMPLLWTPALARDREPEPRRYAEPVGPIPVEHHHAEVEPSGDVYRGLGVPSVALASQVQVLPHAQDAGIPAFIRQIDSTAWFAGDVRTRTVHAVVIQQDDGSVVNAIDDPRGWMAALAWWSRTRADSFSAAWVLAGLHLNACIDRDRYAPPQDVGRLYRAHLDAPEARIELHPDQGATLEYTWWTRGGRPTRIEVPLDARAPCPADLARE